MCGTTSSRSKRRVRGRGGGVAAPCTLALAAVERKSNKKALRAVVASLAEDDWQFE